MRNMWIGISRNKAILPMPCAWVGHTEQETLSSCKASGCTLHDQATCDAEGRLPCYFWFGFRTRGGKRAMNEAAAAGKDYSFERAMSERLAIARYLRLGAGGDHILTVEETVEQAGIARKDHKLGVLGFTHAWRQEAARPLMDCCMASCDSLADLDIALAMGWKGTAILPKEIGVMPRGYAWPGPRTFETPGGNLVHVCTKQINLRVNCNGCGRCDPKRNRIPVGFVQHR